MALPRDALPKMAPEPTPVKARHWRMARGRQTAPPGSSPFRNSNAGGTSGRLVEAGLEPDLNCVLSDIDAKLQLFETVQNRAQNPYDYLEDTK